MSCRSFRVIRRAFVRSSAGWQAALALTAFCLIALGVAVKRNLRSIAWLATAGGVVTAFVVLNATRSPVPAAVALSLLGLGSLRAVHLRKWIGPQWLGALGADAGVAVLALLSRAQHAG